MTTEAMEIAMDPIGALARTSRIAVAAWLTLVHSHGALAGQSLGPSFDDYVRQGMTTWQVPGTVVIVVKDGRVLHSGGYGSRIAGSERAIDSQTRFQIASHSKAVTATAVAMLVDAGTLSWDDPVRKYIPDFAFADPGVAEDVTILDLALHRAELPGTLGGFRNAAYGIEQLLDALRSRPLSSPLRSRQAYSNVGYALLGEVVARASGMSWEEFVRRKIFVPLGMTESYTSYPDLIERFGEPSPERNVMLPARKQAGSVVGAETWTGIGTDRLYAPAGGITTTGEDMVEWLLFLSQGGEYDQKRLLSAAALEETRMPQLLLDPSLSGTTRPISPLAAESPGWIAVPHMGGLLFQAPGGWMSSVVSVLPDKRLAVAVVTNAYFSERATYESLHFVGAVAMRAIDAAVGLPERDWLAEFERTLDRGR